MLSPTAFLIYKRTYFQQVLLSNYYIITDIAIQAASIEEQ